MFDDQVIIHNILQFHHWDDWNGCKLFTLCSRWNSVFFSEHFAFSYLQNVFNLSSEQKKMLEVVLLTNFDRSLERKKKGRKRYLSKDIHDDELHEFHQLDSAWKVLKWYIILKRRSYFYNETISNLNQYLTEHKPSLLDNIIEKMILEKHRLQLYNAKTKFFNNDLYLSENVVITDHVIRKLMRGTFKEVFVENIQNCGNNFQMNYIIILGYGYPLYISLTRSTTDCGRETFCVDSNHVLCTNSFTHNRSPFEAFYSWSNYEQLNYLKKIIFRNSVKELSEDECDGLSRDECFQCVLYRLLNSGTIDEDRFERVTKSLEGDIVVLGIGNDDIDE
ncbi:hypothetical protein FDP41_013588 [Naegleria fowleri]|uniref:Uncharacterized protein n=1 Tax=Naegleria fowleri TaxID=5763 RepID=A0A6A5C1C4_NAEFO|nr:uncharacterized protein FDP41_013588 [Naegleria fowleri]KAF0980374.1 hypothetical protein FDP41_013588 [Naegleria fowleri]CAG4714613.1 unnamed protein product [Naegleria fowleri]